MRNSEMIDTRDLVTELEGLEAEIECYENEEQGPLLVDEKDRAKAIRDLFEKIEGYAGDEPKDGILLIADSYFKTYAQELADDLGFVKSDDWPASCIDWEAAANALQQDYTSVEFDGVTYWYR